jgi:DsbC/DsbD-like thiol-disulfide interchange protein
MEIGGGASLMDAAEMELCSDISVSKQADMHLCQTCTRIADSIPDPSDPTNVAKADDYSPTREEIEAAIQLSQEQQNEEALEP